MMLALGVCLSLNMSPVLLIVATVLQLLHTHTYVCIYIHVYGMLNNRPLTITIKHSNLRRYKSVKLWFIFGEKELMTVVSSLPFNEQ